MTKDEACSLVLAEWRSIPRAKFIFPILRALASRKHRRRSFDSWGSRCNHPSTGKEREWPV